MKLSLLAYIVCPSCHAELNCEANLKEEGEIIEGKLICRSCQETYPIVRSIPRLLVNAQRSFDKPTADAFGWEWQEFSELHGIDEYRDQFLDWIKPVQPEFLRDKIILDAGCGMGRFALVASALGAKEVIAMDLSNAVEAARDNARPYANIHVIQGNIYQPPLRRAATAQIDFVYCIGVLHHLPDPEGGFRSLTQHVKPDGAILGWVYGRENNGWLVHFVNPIREGLTSRAPRSMLYALSFVIAVIFQFAFALIYRPIYQIDSLTRLRRLLPYSAYMGWLSKFGFRHTHHVIFDHLVAPRAAYIRQEDFRAWFKRAHLREVVITWRNQNSWRGLGFR